MIVDRKNVIVVGSSQVAVKPFEVRGLTLIYRRVAEITEGDFATACGILVAEPPGQYRELRALADGGAIRAFEMSLVIGILPVDLPASTQARIFAAGIPQASQPHRWPPEDGRGWIYINTEHEALAEAFRTHLPGPCAGSPEILPFDPSKSILPDHILPLRRAFGDASKLIVEPLTEGKTADGTYRVFVERGAPNGGPHPMPFVFKVAKTEKATDGDEWVNPLYRERNNYCQWAEPFIPFHLRPGLLEERCLTTPLWAAISCHFVEGAVSFETVLQNRQAAGLVFSLFETTLRGLRAHTLQSDLQPEVVRTFILDRVDAQRFSKNETLAARVVMAAKHGFTGTPEGLQTDLATAAESLKSRSGIYHGDLHVGNIMVRQRDAIVIDFGSMHDFGPITADPGALEASIVFGTRPAASEKLQAAWREYVDRLYNTPLEPPLPSAEHFQFAWMNQAVRELRHVVCCCGAAETEILLILSASLLRFARFSPFDYDDPLVKKLSEDRKAYALVVAQRIYREAIKSKKSA